MIQFASCMTDPGARHQEQTGKLKQYYTTKTYEKGKDENNGIHLTQTGSWLDHEWR